MSKTLAKYCEGCVFKTLAKSSMLHIGSILWKRWNVVEGKLLSILQQSLHISLDHNWHTLRSSKIYAVIINTNIFHIPTKVWYLYLMRTTPCCVSPFLLKLKVYNELGIPILHLYRWIRKNNTLSAMKFCKYKRKSFRDIRRYLYYLKLFDLP